MIIDENSNETFEDLGKMNELQHFEIRSCHGSSLNISKLVPTTENFDVLTEITIEDCQLEEIPMEILTQSRNLKTLNLKKNKIINLKKSDFNGIAKSVSENFGVLTYLVC